MGSLFGGSNKGMVEAANRQAAATAAAAAASAKQAKLQAAGLQQQQETADARAKLAQAAEDLANSQPKEKVNIDTSIPVDMTVDSTGKRINPRQQFKVSTRASTSTSGGSGISL